MKLKDKIAFIQHAIDGLSKKEENPFFHSKYVDLNQIIDALRPMELEQKISITMPLSSDGGRPAVGLIIKDLEGDEVIENFVTIPDLQDPQKMGSAITYFRRYALMSFFNLKAEDDDAEGTKEQPKNKGIVNKPKVDPKSSAEATKESLGW